MKKKNNQGEFTDQGSRDFAAKNLIFDEIAKPFSPMRLMAAQAMGLRFFKLNEREREQLNDMNYIYDGMMWDAAVCAYLCLPSTPDHILFRSVRTPEPVMRDIEKWMDDNQLMPGSPKFSSVLDHYTHIMEQMIRSAAQAVPLDSKEKSKLPPATLPGE